jgi:WD40 repeat protein
MRNGTVYFSLSLIAVSLLTCYSLLAQKNQDAPSVKIVNSEDFKFREIGTLPKIIKEASGLEMINGRLWTHNDGGLPVLYCIDTTANLVKTVYLNHPNTGWEDLAQDEHGNLFVGAFGNNKNDKKLCKIYIIQPPDSIKTNVYTAQVIKYTYRDQKAFPPPPQQKNFDVDAFICFNDSLYLFSKNRTAPFTGFTRIYSLPQAPGEYQAITVDSIYLGKGAMMDFWITGADISPDKKILALLSHDCIWFIKDFKSGKFSSGKIIKLNLKHFSHKAGICFSSNRHLYIVDELELDLIGGKLYDLDLTQLDSYFK